jgi:CHAT domain-containing protein/Tfp pilus assembly protein PilF
MPAPEPIPIPGPNAEIDFETTRPLAELKADLARAEAAQDKGAIAQCLIVLAVQYFYRGENHEALAQLNRALPMVRGMGNRSAEPVTLYILGMVNDSLGRKQNALDSLSAALAIERETGNTTLEAQTLDQIGMVYYTMGEQDHALSTFNLAIELAGPLDDRRIEAAILDGIALVEYTRGEEETAQEDLSRAMAIQNAADDDRGRAATLTAMGLVYTYLGQQDQALDSFKEALTIEKKAGDRRAEAAALNNIGWTYDAKGDKQRALDYLNQALPMQEAIRDIAGEGYTLDSIGLVYQHRGEYQKAVDTYMRALPIERQAGDRDCEGNSLWGIGDAERKLGRMSDALRDGLAALSLARTIGDSDLQGRVENSLMRYFRGAHQDETAILFGTDAVNQFQRARRNISGLGRDVQATFVQSKAETYRELAELLMESDRLGERLGQAEQILDLLKEQELREVVRGEAPSSSAKVAPLALTTAQTKAEAELTVPETTAEGLASQSIEYASLVDKEQPTPQEKARLKALDAQIEVGNAEIDAFFEKTLFPELVSAVGTKRANDLMSDEESRVSGLQNSLLALGPDVVGIRLLFGEQHVYALVVTARARRKFELSAEPAALREKVLQVREELRTPVSDPRQHLEELYKIIVAPLEPELTDLETHRQPSGRAPTLLWSLDGAVRYLPMSALYDGKRYLAERFNNVLVTPESYAHLADRLESGNATPQVLAMGLTKSYGGLPALPGVMPELEAVVRDPAITASHGPLEGRLFSDEQFTLDAMKKFLGSGKKFSVVHIASHFVENDTNGQEPYLMMGGDSEPSPDGFALTLSKLQRSTLSFHGTRLLTLSACSTAIGNTRGDGMEVESLGMVAQGKDAEALLETLWDVNDARTSQLMSDFYARWAAQPGSGKAEALRQAQLAFIRSAPTPGSKANDRGFVLPPPESTAQRTASFAHPYYWAPFVLVGNFQ